MCGLIGGAVPAHLVAAALPFIKHRGPDASGIITAGAFTLGHTRLAVQDVQGAPGQPVVGRETVVTYNGEAWNPQSLRDAFPASHKWASTGDTEPVAALIERDGPAALPLLTRAMFALAWVSGDWAYLARDTYGEVPLHYGFTAEGHPVWASEVAALLVLGARPSTVTWVEPGTLVMLSASGAGTVSTWAKPVDIRPQPLTPEGMRTHLEKGVVDRMTADVPVAVLCSGGLDSSAVLATLIKHGYTPHAYTAVHDTRSPDLRHARAVTSHLGIDLTEVTIPSPTRADLNAAVTVTEMPHKAQVEIAVACAPLAARISADGFRVLLSGEGADELLASYGMAFHGIQKHGWGPYRRDLFIGQHRKNFARTNKVFMRYGIEARLPFLDDGLARAVLAATKDDVTLQGRHPKAILAAAFQDALPEGSAWRTKAAFQTAAKLDKAAATTVADPRAYYHAEYVRTFQGVKP